MTSPWFCSPESTSKNPNFDDAIISLHTPYQGPKNRQNMRRPCNVYKVVLSRSKIPVCLNKQCKSKWWRILTLPLMKPQIRKVPFLYYVSTCTVQNLIWLPNFSQKLGFFFVKTKQFLFTFSILTKFHAEVWNF